MTIPKEHIEALRETFRQRMGEQDFCIGQEKVERLFRELLGEPEPITERHYDHSDSRITAKEITDIMKEHFRNLENLFEQDSAFYNKLKGR